jgi:hypothetical protein
MWTKLISFEPKAKNTFPSFRIQQSKLLLPQAIIIKTEVFLAPAQCYDDDEPMNVYMNVYECNEMM